ncbi:MULTISPECIES: aminodeoxychorismate synthase component I [Anaeromyxobacter]|uniref:aminodeoxychorismate synthase component I n=1 Tax=Anaeromyxobacter TaxID=161492 RepID=UPI001F599D38|nr:MULTISPECIES: aminodeoxychorismate synthase component I [unclassified Anaeromyxobacter]
MRSARLDLAPFGRLDFGEPARVIATDDVRRVRAALVEVEAEARRGRWAAGFVSYEAAPGLDPAIAVRRGSGPLVWFGIHDAPATAAAPSAAEVAAARVDDLAPEVTRAQHVADVEAVRAALGRGDAYQVNLTFRMRGRFTGDPFALYERLRRAQGGGFTGCLVVDGRAILSASPELFFYRQGDRVEVRPMKGTARRGRDLAEDERAAAALAASPKERAENVMIVDLLRNDLGRVARVGSVRVGELFTVERYPTVLQLTSTVEARLRPSAGLAELFAALFPCGSVTGAPKIAATKLIADLERSPRGPYCGAVGVVAPGGDAVFDVAIRTLDLDLESGAATYGVGGGITWGSDPEREWDEAMAKAAVLSEPADDLQLLETLRLFGGAYARLERHLARLAGSARYLGIPLELAAVRAALEAEASRAPAEGARIRLLVGLDGRPRTEAAPLPPPAQAPLPVTLARAPVDRADRLLFHKTTRREVYASRRAERPEAFDVILQNAEGELTELTIGNLVVEVGGERLTPPVDAGLLAGTMRAELLERGEVREAVLRPEDLARAARLWLVNSVRGWVPIRYVP